MFEKCERCKDDGIPVVLIGDYHTFLCADCSNQWHDVFYKSLSMFLGIRRIEEDIRIYEIRLIGRSDEQLELRLRDCYAKFRSVNEILFKIGGDFAKGGVDVTEPEYLDRFISKAVLP